MKQQKESLYYVFHGRGCDTYKRPYNVKALSTKGVVTTGPRIDVDKNLPKKYWELVEDCNVITEAGDIRKSIVDKNIAEYRQQKLDAAARHRLGEIKRHDEEKLPTLWAGVAFLTLLQIAMIALFFLGRYGVI